MRPSTEVNSFQKVLVEVIRVYKRVYGSSDRLTRFLHIEFLLSTYFHSLFFLSASLPIINLFLLFLLSSYFYFHPLFLIINLFPLFSSLSLFFLSSSLPINNLFLLLLLFFLSSFSLSLSLSPIFPHISFFLHPLLS